MPTSSLIPVPFHGATLFLVEHDGEAFVPMKSIVEGMGLNWDSQLDKLRANKERWGIAIIATPSNGGQQSTVCLPLRKLCGWMMTIHPNKVAEELRPKIICYQNECDDVLWDYWTKGQAANPHKVGRTKAAEPSGPPAFITNFWGQLNRLEGR